MPGQEKVIADVIAERQYQDAKWGGAAHDATEGNDDWVRYVVEYATGQGRAADYDFRKRMVKAAALAVAAVEAFDRKRPAV